MTFLECVNRILRENNHIRGDTDPIASFDETQHNAVTNLAILAVQGELTDLVSDRLIPYERTSGTITLTTNLRYYDLASNFIRFYSKPLFYNSTVNRQIYEYVDEGTYDANGKWVFRRRWNGDQTDYGLNFSSATQLLRVKLATY